ncbi:MAG: hypothetical protein EOP34_06440 [Rickettsiales bacterium]|nr:MAG: hypothetical protein EOP34_06440 [Rickettsiales bacterium]
MAINTTTNSLYIKINDSWTCITANSLNTIQSVTQLNNTLGSENDICFNTKSGIIYVKQNNNWDESGYFLIQDMDNSQNLPVYLSKIIDNTQQKNLFNVNGCLQLNNTVDSKLVLKSDNLHMINNMGSFFYKIVQTQTFDSTLQILYNIDINDYLTSAFTCVNLLLECDISVGNVTTRQTTAGSGCIQFTFKVTYINSMYTVSDASKTNIILDNELSSVVVILSKNSDSSKCMLRVGGLNQTTINWFGLIKIVAVYY